MSTTNNPLAPSAAFVASVAHKNATPQVYDTAAIQKMDSAHYLHPFTDFQDLASKGARVMVRGEGVYLWDSQGKKIVDGMSGLWCVNVGYGRTSISQAVYQQMETLPFYNSFFGTTNLPAAQLAAKLAQISPPQFEHVFFTSSGSEANDTNLRMVRRYWDLLGYKERHTIISRHNAYHGSTVAGASLGGMDGMHAQGGLPIPGIVHIGQPNYLEAGQGLTPEEFGLKAAGWLEEKILEVGADKVAAFIGEPVQGAGGVIIPPKGYWPKVEAVVRKYGLLMVSDEVICGFGRTGKMWGHEAMGFTPDLMPMAKGLSSGYLPISATAVAPHVVEVLKTGGDFVHGFTYSGHPVCAAVALKNIEIIEREGLVERTGSITGPHLAKALASLNDHPLVGETRSIGLLGAVEIVADKKTRARFGGAEGTAGPMARDACIASGLMVRGIRDSLVMCPPLVISTEQIDDMVAIIRKSLDEVLPKLRAL